jgi:hypothetical protein
MAAVAYAKAKAKAKALVGAPLLKRRTTRTKGHVDVLYVAAI